MASVKVRDAAGAEKGSVDLDESWFGIEPNVPVMHQVVTAQLAARRSGTQSTKTRAEVRGGGAKPWKQKGTGRARQGSIRAPQWKGGGVALGPKPRSYAQRTPKKMIRLALRSALSDRAAEGKVIVLDDWGFESPSTRSAAALLGAIGVEGRIVVVVGAQDAVAVKSFRNLPQVHLLEPGELNAYDILVSDYVVFTRDNLPSSSDEASTKAKAKPEAKPKPEAKAKAKAAAKAKPGAGAASANKATVVDAPAVTEPENETVSSDAGGDSDMASDLPSRPKPTGEATKPVDPSERVKPAGDKTDPRFEAARIKAEKEAEIRARQQAAASGEPVATDVSDDSTGDAANESDESQSSGGFSFNQTVQNEGDQS
jgi:large subunit ribosomal protein L4